MFLQIKTKNKFFVFLIFFFNFFLFIPPGFYMMTYPSILEICAQLRSPDFTLQCLAVSKIPEFLSNHPNPDEIKTIFRLLAERFCAKDITNYFRSVIVRITEEISQKYICHITNNEDQDKIIYDVNYINSSGDPTARTLAIKMLGALVSIAVDKNNVKHNVRRALLSKDRDERSAAIQTTKVFAAYSINFARELLPELEVLIFGGFRKVEAKIEKTEKHEQKVCQKPQKFDLFTDNFQDCTKEKTTTKQEVIQKIYREILPEMKGNLKIAEKAVNLCLKGLEDENFCLIALDSAVELVKNIRPLAGALIENLLRRITTGILVKKESIQSSTSLMSDSTSKANSKANKTLNSAIKKALLNLAQNLPKMWSVKHAQNCIDLTIKMKQQKMGSNDLEIMSLICCHLLITHKSLRHQASSLVSTNGDNDTQSDNDLDQISKSRAILKILNYKYNEEKGEILPYPVREFIYIFMNEEISQNGSVLHGLKSS